MRSRSLDHRSRSVDADWIENGRRGFRACLRDEVVGRKGHVMIAHFAVHH